MAFSLASYNIYKGGQNGFDKLVSATRDLKADCIGVLEATGWGEDNQKILQQFSTMTERPFSCFVKANTEYDLACVSRIAPRSNTSCTTGFWHAVLINIFSTVELGDVAVAFVHLNPHAEAARVQEIDGLRSFLQQYTNVFVLGDFNSLSPRDPYDRADVLKRLQEIGISKFGSAALTFDAVQSMEAAGFVDCAAAHLSFVSTVPTPSNKDSAHQLSLRIDYAFATPSLIPFVQAVTVPKGGSFDGASDHFPLVVDTRLTPVVL